MRSMTTLFKRTRTLFWVFLLWTLWVLFYALIMYLQIGVIPFTVALISSANYNYIFAFISILIWIICKQIPLEQTNRIIFILFHFVSGIFFSSLWIFSMYSLWYLAEGEIIFKRVNIREIIGWQFLFGMIQYFFVAGIFYTVIYYRGYKQKQLLESELKILTRDAELKALKLQINPHFLFNSLNSINALVTQNPVLARKMIALLSELLRMSLESRDQLLIPLKEELNLIHKYLEIERIRFSEKMIYEENVDPELLTHPFPAMLLQPLLENAVKHGIANSLRGGTIQLTIEKLTTHLRITVINRSADQLLLQTDDNVGNGTGLENIRQRLDRLYGDRYFGQVDRSEETAYKVVFELPLI